MPDTNAAPENASNEQLIEQVHILNDMVETFKQRWIVEMNSCMEKETQLKSALRRIETLERQAKLRAEMLASASPQALTPVMDVRCVTPQV